ncbi:cucumisin-like [Impatiens glandulifera]|uniref:cucumisin-like n=1 Tax=Impatiens glandulifera TaxID=253017 RepID=UPI001FB0B557|nr:cucumisin-like [Impatiens glandulifera]
MKGVVSVFPNRNNDMLTTRSWDFINFPESIKRNTVESNIIVAVIDSGIWPESISFQNSRFSFLWRPPNKWKGSCSSGLTNFTCNNKIIGARYYKKNGHFSTEDDQSPRDTIGHGTYMASIIAGNIDKSASFFGLGTGTARGGVPSSLIAAYKVCWSSGCDDADIIAAFADAITDGVDIISISMGDENPISYFTNSLSIGSFKAMRNGILTIVPTGNKGPKPSSLVNVFPWVLSVGASTIDRNFINNIQMGSGMVVKGVSINMFDSSNYYPMVYGSDVPNKIMNVSMNVSRTCQRNSLDTTLVKDKIVICDEYNIGTEALSVGAAGMVIRARERKDDSEAFVLPTTYVIGNQINRMSDYYMRLRALNMTPTAVIFKTTEGLDASSPYIGSFSSRGPNLLTPEILKPDLCAPGVHILAAWTPLNSPTKEQIDKRRSPYNILSGTSMASSHVAAAAAYVKSFNPSWSPAAIKSALITTASKMSETTTPDAEFAYGAGQINIASAISPGLVYDAEIDDYVRFLCGQGYTNEQLYLLTSEHTSCTTYGSTISSNLNMPSFSIPVSRSTRFNVTMTRKITNVGTESFTYEAVISSPPSVQIRVVPNKLLFYKVGTTVQFTMIVEGILTRENMVSASLSWIGPQNTVRSPIVVFVREQP